MALTKDLETRVVREMFAQAEAVGWTYLPDKERTEIYSRWFNAPEIGGRLREFMPAEDVRVWLKDSVMKEYARSIYGFGKFAPLVANPATGPNELIRRALREGWVVDPSSRRIKPLRVRARRGEEEIYFAWAPSRGLKHLVWAALTAEAAGDPTPWVLCIVGSFERPTPPDEMAAHQRLGERCQLRIVHVNGD